MSTLRVEQCVAHGNECYVPGGRILLLLLLFVTSRNGSRVGFSLTTVENPIEFWSEV